MKTIILFVFSLILFSDLYSQVSQEWLSRYNGPGNGNDYGYSIAIDDTGNVYVTGRSIGNGTNYDYGTIKYNSSGVEQWVTRYNGPGNAIDHAVSIALDSLGNVYVAGYSFGSGTNYDYASVKYNSSGIQQWVARYNGTGNSFDYITSMSLDRSGNVYVTGYSFGSGTDNDIATVKYNSSGIEQWVRRYNGPGNGNDRAYSVASDPSGNVYVTGYSLGVGTSRDYTTIKYNSSGVLQWIHRYDGTGNGNDQPLSLGVDISGNIYITGLSTGIGSGFDIATVKYNSLGVLQWVQRYNGPGGDNDAGYSIAIDDSGNVIITGESVGIATGSDYTTIKYSPSGVEQWVQRYNGPGNLVDSPISMRLDSLCNVYVTGYSVGNGTNRDYATIKYNSSGVEQWIQRYDGPGSGSDEGISIALDNSGNVYITGESEGIGSGFDCVTVKYSQVIGIAQISNAVPDNFVLEQNYPNPFNPITNIEFSIPKQENVKITVYDALGKEIASLLDQRLSAGTYKVDFDGTGYSSGVYFYRLETGDFAETKSMVLLK